jgi:hypothetical protein
MTNTFQSCVYSLLSKHYIKIIIGLIVLNRKSIAALLDPNHPKKLKKEKLPFNDHPVVVASGHMVKRLFNLMQVNPILY